MTAVAVVAWLNSRMRKPGSCTTPVLPACNRNKITVFRFQLDLITKQNNEDTNKVLLNHSGNGFRVCNEPGILG